MYLIYILFPVMTEGFNHFKSEVKVIVNCYIFKCSRGLFLSLLLERCAFCITSWYLWASFYSVIRDHGLNYCIWEHSQYCFGGFLKGFYPDFRLFSLLFHQRGTQVQRVKEICSIFRDWDLNAPEEGPAWKLNNLLLTDGLSCDRWNIWIKEDGEV